MEARYSWRKLKAIFHICVEDGLAQLRTRHPLAHLIRRTWKDPSFFKYIANIDKEYHVNLPSLHSESFQGAIVPANLMCDQDTHKGTLLVAT